LGRMIEFQRPDGKKAPGYLAEPPDAPSTLPGVVMIEEWWGVNDQIKETADRLSGVGFRVVVPDLFRGRVAATGEEANHLMQGLDFADATSQDVVGAGDYLRHQGALKVGITGFCMGGAIALLTVMHGARFDAAVVFYGLPPADAGDPGKIRVPVMGHWAERDEFFDIERVNELQARLDEAGVPHEFHRYDAAHAFCNPGGLGNYAREHAETAWRRTVDFFTRTLK
jgi:carboxymethylenebutenolidase